MTLVGQRFNKRKFLLVLIGLFIVGNAMSALAGSFGMVIAGRIVASLTHGAFIGTASIIAARSVPPQRKTSAIALIFSGLTLATLIGTPIATWISSTVSWRASFLMISGIGVVALTGILLLLPKAQEEEPFNFKSELRAFANPQLLLAMVITVLGPAGFFTSVTYIAPITMNVTGTPESWVTIFMAVFGLGLFIGNYLGGKLADKNLMLLLLSTLAIQAVALVVFWLGAGNLVIAFVMVFLMAASGFASVSPIQNLVMEKAEQAGAPNLASSMNIGMFNLGNAIGAWLGGLTISAGLGDSSPNLAGAVLAATAFLVGLVILAQRKKAIAPTKEFANAH